MVWIALIKRSSQEAFGNSSLEEASEKNTNPRNPPLLEQRQAEKSIGEQKMSVFVKNGMRNVMLTIIV